MGLKERNRNRLKGYDYGQNGAYFVTVCTHNRQQLLSRIVGEGLCALPSVKLTEVGLIVDNYIKYIQNNLAGITVDNYIIMPNHIHLLVAIDNEATGGRGSPPLHNVIGRLKSYSTHAYGGRLWQRSFHDHIIRDESDYQKINEYIEYNATKWNVDCFYVK